MSRDWQKDKRYLQELNNWEMDPDDEVVYKIATHYHQQYAAEKERGDMLKEALMIYISEGMYRDEAISFFSELLDSLYPKEEAKQ